MEQLRRLFTSFIFIIVATWLLLAGLLYIFQARFIYYPQKSISYTPADIQLSYEDVVINTRDDINIHGWFIKHPAQIATLLFLHGNAGNISHRLDSLQIFHDLGLSVLIIDYRGYGRSTGTTTERGTYLDADAAWNYLTIEKNIDPIHIIVFGRSLGGAVATELAMQRPAAALILESTFTSTSDMAKQFYPYLPVKLLTRIKYPSIEKINKISCPLLVIHSQNDEIVPYQLGRELFEKAKHPKYFLDISGGHNDGFLISGNIYVEGIDNFISSHIHL